MFQTFKCVTVQHNKTKKVKKNGMLCHSNFSLRENFKLQPFITVFAVFLFTCLEKACLLLSRAKRGTAKGLAFSRRVNKKTAIGSVKGLHLKFSLKLKSEWHILSLLKRCYTFQAIQAKYRESEMNIYTTTLSRFPLPLKEEFSLYQKL